MKVFLTRFWVIFFWLFSFSSSFSSLALSPETHLAVEADEQRANKLFLQVRCLVCGGQVIENSDSEFSFEMRKFIRQKISQGKSNEQIKSELINKFGADILTEINEPKSWLILWLLPLIFAALVAFQFFKKR